VELKLNTFNDLTKIAIKGLGKQLRREDIFNEI
jgi:hypothetical protein